MTSWEIGLKMHTSSMVQWDHCCDGIFIKAGGLRTGLLPGGVKEGVWQKPWWLSQHFPHRQMVQESCVQDPEVGDSMPCLKGSCKSAGTSSTFAPYCRSVHSELLSSLEYTAMHMSLSLYTCIQVFTTKLQHVQDNGIQIYDKTYVSSLLSLPPWKHHFNFLSSCR